jgi:hypothetical protein
MALWYILAVLVYVMVIWYLYYHFGIFLPFRLVVPRKKFGNSGHYVCKAGRFKIGRRNLLPILLFISLSFFLVFVLSSPLGCRQTNVDGGKRGINTEAEIGVYGAG